MSDGWSLYIVYDNSVRCCWPMCPIGLPWCAQVYDRIVIIVPYLDPVLLWA